MKIEIGRRYRFEPDEAYASLMPKEIVTVGEGLFGVGTLFVWFASGRLGMVGDDGTLPGIGRLVEIEDPAPAAPPPTLTTLRPIFGHDADEFARLQRVFREGRDLTLGTGR